MSIDSAKQLLAWKPPYLGNPFIADGILLPETRMIIFGEAGSWKSNLALHTMFSISQGKEWMGYKTQPAVVLKVQAELPKYIDRERLVVYGASAGLLPDNIFFKTVGDTIGGDERVKLDTTFGMQALAKYIEEVQARNPSAQLVVLLDPLKDVMAGKITDEYDVRKFQDNLNSLISKYHFAVIIFHHSRKRQAAGNGEGYLDGGGEESLGSIHWKNWCDTMLRSVIINPYSGSDIIEYRWEKHRNARKYLKSFKAQWSRGTLLPTILVEEAVDVEDISIHGFQGD